MLIGRRFPIGSTLACGRTRRRAAEHVAAPFSEELGVSGASIKHVLLGAFQAASQGSVPQTKESAVA